MLEVGIREKLVGFYVLIIFGIMPMVITPWRSESFYDGKLVLVGVITIFFAALLLVRFRVNESKESKPSKSSIMRGLIVAMLILALLSTMFSTDLSISIYGHPNCREGLLSLVIYFIIFYIGYREFSFSAVVLEAILIISSFISLYGILSYCNIVPGIEQIFKLKYTGGLSTIGNRNFVGAYCTLLIPLSLGYYFKYRNNRIFVYIGLLFGLLLACKTRGAWIAVGISVLLFLGVILKIAYSRKSILFVIGFMLMATAIFGTLNYLKNNDLSKRFNSIIVDTKNLNNDKTGSNRVFYWKRTIPFMFDYPFLGSGPDTFGKIFKAKVGVEIPLYAKANNEYLQMAVTLGYPYLIAYLYFVGIISLRLIKKAVLKGDIYALTIFCCIVGYLIQAFFNISAISTAPIYWGLLGIGAKISEEKYEE